MVLANRSRQHPEPGLRLSLVRSDRARPASQRQFLLRRTRHALLQHLPVASHRRTLRRVSPRSETPRTDSFARRLSGRPAQRRHVLVLRYLLHLGHIPPPGPDRSRLHRLRHGLLEQRHRRLGAFPPEHHPLKPPLLDPSDARDNVGGYDDFPEFYTRWFEYGVFVPIFRTHGSRLSNEIWSYGKAAQPILEKYLKLRYRLMPYIYSLAHLTHESGAPYMRALFMDFPNDPQCRGHRRRIHVRSRISGRAGHRTGRDHADRLPPGRRVLVQLLDQAATPGGQTITVEAPIDTLPLFVRAGSIVPMGEPVRSTREPQKLARSTGISRRRRRFHPLR